MRLKGDSFRHLFLAELPTTLQLIPQQLCMRTSFLHPLPNVISQKLALLQKK